MSTTAPPPDFSSFERFNNEFSALIDNMIPRDFGTSSTKNGSSSATETADEIIERNRAKKQKERHRSIISGGQAQPQTAASSISATTLPLVNALSLKRRHLDEPTAVTSNGHTNGTNTKEDSEDDDEEESRTRVVTKKSKTTRDAFSTKKSGKVKTQSKLVVQTSGKGKMPVVKGDMESIPTSTSANGEEDVVVETTPKPSEGEPQSAASYNPFKIPSTPFSSTQPGIKDIFSSLPTPASSTSHLDTTDAQSPVSATTQAPPSDDPARTRTGMTPPPGLHGKDRKRWRKKMKKMQMKKDGEEKAGGEDDEGDED